jgi:hypothetical protein
VLLHLLELSSHSELLLFPICILFLPRKTGINEDSAPLLRDYIEVHGTCVEVVLLLPLLKDPSTLWFDGHPALISKGVQRVDFVGLHELVAHIHLPIRFELICDSCSGIMGAFAFATQTPHSLGLFPIVLDFDSKFYRRDAVCGVHFAIDGHTSFNEVDPDPLGIRIRRYRDMVILEADHDPAQMILQELDVLIYP